MNTPDEINFALMIVTASMAVATGLLALFTYKLAKDTVEGNRQSDKHHRQDLRPFCVLDFAGAAHPHLMFGADFDPAARRIKANMSVIGTKSLGNEIYICGELTNKGKGPAKDVVAYLNMRRGPGEGGAFRLTRPVVATGLLGSSETIEIDIAITERDTMKVWIGDKWRDSCAIEFIPDETYEVVLEYKDVFESCFRTVYAKGIWHDPLLDTQSINKVEKQREMMIRPNMPMPVFLCGSQAVQTLADFVQLPQAPEPQNSSDF